MFDRNQNILLTKTVSQTSSYTPAARSNIVCYITLLERVAGALSWQTRAGKPKLACVKDTTTVGKTC